MKLEESLDELITLTEIGFEKYPKGWDRGSVKKFADTITKDVGKDPDDKGWFDA